jgi:hypothetical protein
MSNNLVERILKWAEYDRLVRVSNAVDSRTMADCDAHIDERHAAVEAFDAYVFLAEEAGPRPTKAELVDLATSTTPPGLCWHLGGYSPVESWQCELPVGHDGDDHSGEGCTWTEGRPYTGLNGGYSAEPGLDSNRLIERRMLPIPPDGAFCDHSTMTQCCEDIECGHLFCPCGISWDEESEGHFTMDDMIFIDDELAIGDLGKSTPRFVEPTDRSVDPMDRAPFLRERWQPGIRAPLNRAESDLLSDIYRWPEPDYSVKPLALEPFIKTKSKYGRSPKSTSLDRNGRVRAKVLREAGHRRHGAS